MAILDSKPFKAYRIVIDTPRGNTGTINLANAKLMYENALYLGANVLSPEARQGLTTVSPAVLPNFAPEVVIPPQALENPAMMLVWVLSYIYEEPANLNQVPGAIAEVVTL